ncbi:MAG: hypothetical protein ACOYEV_00740 [Candidatus Nanopelagicales bacterium]
MSTPQPELVVTGTDTEIRICPRGGHLMSWVAGGADRFWMSELSRCGDSAALRGGVPILFPQFSTFGPLAKHGFARTSNWLVESSGTTAGRATAALVLHDAAVTRSVWPNQFELRLEVSASADTLEMALTATNLDDYEATFTAGLHNYFAVRDPGARIVGLAGCQSWDQLARPDHPLPRIPVTEEALDPRETRDLIVYDVPGEVVLEDAELGRLSLTATGFPERVIWNPGPNHYLPDVRPGAEADWVCIEPAALTPVELGAGESWTGTQTVSVRAL